MNQDSVRIGIMSSSYQKLIISLIVNNTIIALFEISILLLFIFVDIYRCGN